MSSLALMAHVRRKTLTAIMDGKAPPNIKRILLILLGVMLVTLVGSHVNGAVEGTPTLYGGGMVWYVLALLNFDMFINSAMTDLEYCAHVTRSSQDPCGHHGR